MEIEWFYSLTAIEFITIQSIDGLSIDIMNSPNAFFIQAFLGTDFSNEPTDRMFGLIEFKTVPRW